jgi:hypothetical protein
MAIGMCHRNIYVPPVRELRRDYWTYAFAFQKPFQPSAERIATILLLLVFRPQGEKPATENQKIPCCRRLQTTLL